MVEFRHSSHYGYSPNAVFAFSIYAMVKYPWANEGEGTETAIFDVLCVLSRILSCKMNLIK